MSSMIPNSQKMERLNQIWESMRANFDDKSWEGVRYAESLALLEIELWAHASIVGLIYDMALRRGVAEHSLRAAINEFMNYGVGLSETHRI